MFYSCSGVELEFVAPWALLELEAVPCWRVLQQLSLTLVSCIHAGKHGTLPGGRPGWSFGGAEPTCQGSASALW